jgi:hypothetical protein
LVIHAFAPLPRPVDEEDVLPRGRDLELDIDGNVIEELDDVALPGMQLGAWEDDEPLALPDAVYSEVSTLESRESEDGTAATRRSIFRFVP